MTSTKRARIEEEDVVEKHDSVWIEPLSMFKNAPFLNIFQDTHIETIHASPYGNSLADVYTFRHAAVPSGLIELNNAKMRALFQFKHGNGTDLVAGQDFVLNVPCPFRTMWKTKEIFINHDLANTSSNYEHYIAYLKFLFTETPTNYKDKEQLTLAILDTAGQFEHNNGNANAANDEYMGTGYRTHTAAGLAATKNLGARKRHALASTADGIKLIDDLDIPLFAGNGTKKYIPTSFELEIRLTRAPLRQICMGSQLPDNAVNAPATQRLHLNDFELDLPVYKPVEQLRQAINTMLTDKNEEAKYYTVQHRVVVQTITGGNQTYQATDIFNGKVPLRFYIMFLETDNFDGSWVNNCFYFKWHQLNYVSVKKNSNLIHPEIKDSKDAYDMLVKHMNRRNKEMPFPYEDYEKGYAIIMYDLDPHQSSYLQTLSLTTTGNLSVDLKFGAGVPAAGLKVLFIGEFRNQLQISYQAQPRNLYDV